MLIQLLISSEVDLDGFVLAVIVRRRVCIVGGEPIFIADSAEISHHLVVAVDKEYVKQSLPKY